LLLIFFQSRFDDYYELEVGSKFEANDLSSNSSPQSWTHFRISRPLGEGVKPTVQTGFNKFEDVRGESGTRLSITLNEDAVAAGFLQEEIVLKPLLEKILEKSPYSVAFASCSTQDEIQSIIDASRKEEDELLAENQQGDGETETSDLRGMECSDDNDQSIGMSSLLF